MKLSIVIATLCATFLICSGEAILWNNYPTPRPIYQQGSQFNLPGQASYNYQPGVPLPNNIQQLGQVPFNYQGGPINIQQLTQSGSTSSLQGIPIGNQQVVQTQSVPFGFQQQNGIPINTLQQTGFPVNQQFIPQTGALGPIRFPQ